MLSSFLSRAESDDNHLKCAMKQAANKSAPSSLKWIYHINDYHKIYSEYSLPDNYSLFAILNNIPVVRFLFTIPSYKDFIILEIIKAYNR